MLAPRCPYWDACYRRNPEHFREMAHPSSGNEKITQLKILLLIFFFFDFNYFFNFKKQTLTQPKDRRRYTYRFIK